MDIKLQIVSPSDAQELLELYAPYVENTAVTFECAVPSLDEFRFRIDNTVRRYPYFIAKKDGVTVGYTYAGPLKNRAAYDWAVETSIYVDKRCHRLGIGKRLYDALERSLSMMNITNMNACIAVPETESEYLDFSSMHFHTAMGFERIGVFHRCGYKFSRWFSMLWMEKMISAHNDVQPPVIPFSALRDRVEKEILI